MKSSPSHGDDYLRSHFHDLRHHLLPTSPWGGQNQRTVQELLGHKDPKMTMRYSHLSPEHLTSAVESLEAFTEAAEKSTGLKK